MERQAMKDRLLKPWECVAGADYRFIQYYRCLPFSDSQRSELDNTNKVIMPFSALDRLTFLNTSYPMMFSVHNPGDTLFFDGFGGGRCCHCGVLEFTTEEGFVHMPQWMMEKLELSPGDLVFFQSTTLRKGTYVKLQPHATDFINLSDPKAVLEKTMNEYSCLTAGDSITISHCGKQFGINIVETRPEVAIDIVDTDCEVEFMAPLDYKEPEKKVEKMKDGEKKENGGDEFIPFKGIGKRLDGRACVESAGDRKLKEVAAVNCTESSCQTGGGRKSGKLVFGPEAKNGGGDNKPHRYLSNAKDEGVSKKDEINKFQAFTGKKRSLI